MKPLISSVRIADNAKITINDGNSDITARISEKDGKYVIYVIFPATEKADLFEVLQPEDISLSRYQAKKEDWNLPDMSFWSMTPVRPCSWNYKDNCR